MRFPGRWLPEQDSYKHACLRLAKNMEVFKVAPDYIGFVGNDTRGPDVVKAFDRVVKSEYVSKNDMIGSPVLHNGKSAGTLRFMKVVEDCHEPDIKDVIEIGGGYGGQCLVYKEMADVTYTIIDIPEALSLAKSYLKANDIECVFISTANVPHMVTDLLISDYCLSEFDQVGIDFYLDRIKFKYGYFTLNGNVEYITKKLRALGYSVTVEDEQPKTSHHPNKILKVKYS